MHDTPLVSVIIPAKNRAELLLQTLASIAAQSYPNWECRVIDDCSTDDTVQAVREFAQADARVTIDVREPGKGGANVCRNLGLERAAGKYVIFLDSDDLLAPQCLEGRVAAMEADPSLDFATFDIEVFQKIPGDLGLLWNAHSELEDLARFLELDVVWQTMAPIWRRQALARLGHWEESLLSFQDWEMHVRAMATGLKYRKFAGVDCFCRYPAGREAISKHVSSPDHLRSHVVLLGKVRQLLERNAALTEPRARRLIGLYLWLADKFRRSGLHAEAARVWRQCRTEKLIGSLAWGEGRAYLLGQRIPLLRRATRMYLLWRWPGEMIRKGSRTVLNTPARPDAVLRPPRRKSAGFYEFPA